MTRSLTPRRPPAAALLIVVLTAFSIASAKAIGPDAYGYLAATTTYNFEDLTSDLYNPAAVLDNSDDDAVTVPLGFSFVFYGTIYTSVSITSNGTLTFVAPDNDWTPVDLTKASPADNRPMIAPFWHDWTFQYAGSDSVYYQTVGTPGSRRLIVQWEAAEPKYGPGVDTVTFEVKLFEGSNNIEFHYMDATVDDDPTNSNGKISTVGIRDVSGQTNGRRLQWLYNQANLVDETAIRYTAPTFAVNSITRLTTKHIFLQCTGSPGTVNKIQSTDDLKNTAFAPLGTSAANSMGSFTYEDAGATNLTRRFYRIVPP